MRQPTRAERLAAFALFGGKELTAGRPLVARLIGRRFDEILDGERYEKPFDPTFAKSMVKTLTHLCTALGCSFGLCERTEMSLFAVGAGGDARRLLSRIGGEAAAKMSLLLSQVATFDTHLYEFPDIGVAREYFQWRLEESEHGAMDRYCVHVLAASGTDPGVVPRIIDGLDADEKVELLRQNSFDYTTVPSWQRRGATVRLRPEGEAEGSARLLVDLNVPADGELGAYLQTALP